MGTPAERSERGTAENAPSRQAPAARPLAEQRAAEYYSLLIALRAVFDSARTTTERPTPTTADDIVRAAVRELCAQLPMVDAAWALTREPASAGGGSYRLLESSLVPRDTAVVSPPTTIGAQTIDKAFAADAGESPLLSREEAAAVAWDARRASRAAPTGLQVALGRTSIAGKDYVLAMAAGQPQDAPPKINSVVASVLNIFGLGTLWGQLAREAARLEWTQLAVAAARRSGSRAAVVKACRRALEAWRESAGASDGAAPVLPADDFDAICADFLDHWRERLAQPRRPWALTEGHLRRRADLLAAAVRWAAPGTASGGEESMVAEVDIGAGPEPEKARDQGGRWVRVPSTCGRTVQALARVYLWVEAALSHAGGDVERDEGPWLEAGARALRGLCERGVIGLPGELFTPARQAAKGDADARKP